MAILEAPGTMIVMAMVALSWQLIAFYGRRQLPVKIADGKPLDRFDTIVDSLPFVTTVPGQGIAVLLAGASAILALLAIRKGHTELTLYGAICGIGTVAVLLTVILPKVAG